jgi:hypothetical protein
MVSLLTMLGLPVLSENIYSDFRDEVRDLKSSDEAQEFYSNLCSKIQEQDQLYLKFIGDTKKMYSGEDIDVAWAQLVSGYELLRRSGELPKLKEERFEKRWKATMNRSVVMLNVSLNMDIISLDNPVFWKFITDSSAYFSGNRKMNILSDLSCGYMFLVDSKRK